MNTLRRSILALSLLVAVTIVTVSAFAQQESAEAAVERYIGSLLKVMTEIQPLYRTDRDAYFDAVENSLSEFVDFREVARGVMAKYGQGSNGASPAQLDRFADVFRESLVEFYGSALAEYGGVEFEILKNQQQSDNDRAANVRMFVLGDDGNRIEVQYSMFLNDEDMWKLRNLYVEGVNLRRQYYSKFDNLMIRNDFDIDKVIDRWQIEE
jgi:phospholipid transport system substrate-binding protein